jgi:predicted enzyme related to lactoylglutathione lyase
MDPDGRSYRMGNKVVHFEVTGKDGAALQAFYGSLFDWEFDTNNPLDYGLVAATENAIGGGVGATGDGSEGLATFYVESDDVAAHLERAKALGGAVIMPSTTVMEGVTIGLFADPEGHIVGLAESAGE